MYPCSLIFVSAGKSEELICCSSVRKRLRSITIL